MLVKVAVSSVDTLWKNETLHHALVMEVLCFPEQFVHVRCYIKKFVAYTEEADSFHPTEQNQNFLLRHSLRQSWSTLCVFDFFRRSVMVEQLWI